MSAPNWTERYEGTIDRTRWLTGPWDDEPLDKGVWRDEATGLDCMVKRGPRGAWCGYVGIPAAHPLHGKGYNEAYDDAPGLSVHGGLTYADACWGEDDPASGICHISDDGPVWWFGFDTLHAWDRGPTSDPEWVMPDQVYRDLGYVIAEVRDLAAQLAEVSR